MKGFFPGAVTAHLSPLLPAGPVSLGDRRAASETIHRPGGDCCIKGKSDSVIRFDDGSYGVVDAKDEPAFPRWFTTSWPCLAYPTRLLLATSAHSAGTVTLQGRPTGDPIDPGRWCHER